MTVAGAFLEMAFPTAVFFLDKGNENFTVSEFMWGITISQAKVQSSLQSNLNEKISALSTKNSQDMSPSQVGKSESKNPAENPPNTYR